ncbi:MAG TPA: DUF465 domain-containing protein [Gammaproteobacteria bacterium]|jgi:hypothetical protein
MFEYDQQIVDALLTQNADFKRLYDKHVELKQRVTEANAGTEPVDDYALENMKKEKLMLKDRMAAMILDYRRAHA